MHTPNNQAYESHRAANLPLCAEALFMMREDMILSGENDYQDMR